MQIQTYDLANLENDFKKVQTDKKKTNLKAIEWVLELNKNINMDKILLRQGLESYPNKA